MQEARVGLLVQDYSNKMGNAEERHQQEVELLIEKHEQDRATHARNQAESLHSQMQLSQELEQRALDAEAKVKATQLAAQQVTRM